MAKASPSIPDDRPLSTAELDIARWMLEHGTLQAAAYLPQLARARVVSRCSCGCASVDLGIDGEPQPGGALEVLGDFVFGTGPTLAGIFVFAQAGRLAGIEVYALAADAPATLPRPELLRPFESETGDSTP